MDLPKSPHVPTANPPSPPVNNQHRTIDVIARRGEQIYGRVGDLAHRAESTQGDGFCGRRAGRGEARHAFCVCYGACLALASLGMRHLG